MLQQRCPSLLFSCKPEAPCISSSRVQTLRVRCAFERSDGVQVTEQADPVELRIPLQQQQLPKFQDDKESSIDEASSSGSRRFLSEIQQNLRKKSPKELALYGGLAGVGLFVGGSILSSLEFLPLVPETLQAVGVGYSMLIAGRVLKGKSDILVKNSPFKAISDLVDEDGVSKVQRTTVVLPQDLDKSVAEALDALAKERDDAINKVEEFKRTAADYARVVAEKEALEAVAMELVKERDAAITEVSGLKTAVQTMQERVSAIESILEKELQQFKQQNKALEAVAMQLANERNSAFKEITELKTIAALRERSEEDKRSLETLVSKLTSERDGALAELEELKEVVASLTASSASGLTPEQEIFIKERVRAVRSQFIDVSQGYDQQKDEVDRFVSHLVDEYGAPREWTMNYMKQFLSSTPSAAVDTWLEGAQAAKIDGSTQQQVD